MSSRRLTSRRPRGNPIASPFVSPRAVFLPPDVTPPSPAEDHPRSDDEFSDDSFYKPELPDVDRSSDASTTPATPRQPSPSNLDSLLENTEPRYTTWRDQRSTTSLSTFSFDHPLLGADELNQSLKPSHLQRHRHVLSPDEAFAAIFTWDSVVSNARELERLAWCVVATENGLPEPDLFDIVRAEQMTPEAAVQRAFYWKAELADIKRYIFRKAQVFDDLHVAFEHTPHRGIIEWLINLRRYGINCILCAPIPRKNLLEAVERLGLDPYFSANDIVSSEDEFHSAEQMFLVAAVKAQRPPSKCVVFTDRTNTITAAHEVSAKAIALVGVHPAFEIRSADQTIPHYEDLVVYNIRRLFSQDDPEFRELRPQLEVETK